jgi:hypothetical protein
MITTETYKTFIYETLDGQFMVTDPLEFDQTIPGGPWNTEAEAIEAFENYIQLHQIIFE